MRQSLTTTQRAALEAIIQPDDVSDFQTALWLMVQSSVETLLATGCSLADLRGLTLGEMGRLCQTQFEIDALNLPKETTARLQAFVDSFTPSQLQH